MKKPKPTPTSAPRKKLQRSVEEFVETMDDAISTLIAARQIITVLTAELTKKESTK